MSIASLMAAVAAAPSSAVANHHVTFARDVAPLIQSKCEVCHRAGSIAPMPLQTYQEIRPWARAIRQRVLSRQMPPWHVDRTAGVQKFKNDRSLSESEIERIVRWVDEGAPFGDPADAPRPLNWPDDETWTIGTPDLIVTSPPHRLASQGPDWLGDYIVDTGLTEDRYVMAIETKPSRAGRRALHHALTFLRSGATPSGAARRRAGPSRGMAREAYLSEYAVGKHGDVFPPGTGRLMKAGSKLRFNMHYHSVGQELEDRTRVGFVFYPRGYVPEHEVVDITVGLLELDDALDIPANSVVEHRAAERLTRPARLISFQPHMHMRGKAMRLDAIGPDGGVTTVGAVDRFDFNWHIAYIFADEVAPILAAGTVLRATATYDNTADNPRNPDPDQWVGFGNRSIDEMLQCHVLLVYLDEPSHRTITSLPGARGRR